MAFPESNVKRGSAFNHWTLDLVQRCLQEMPFDFHILLTTGVWRFQFARLGELTVGPVSYAEQGNGTLVPLTICKEYYRKGDVQPSDEYYDIDSQTETGQLCEMGHFLIFGQPSLQGEPVAAMTDPFHIFFFFLYSGYSPCSLLESWSPEHDHMEKRQITFFSSRFLQVKNKPNFRFYIYRKKWNHNEWGSLFIVGSLILRSPFN